MTDIIVDWARIHSVEGDELVKLRKYNRQAIHGEWIHEDRFRYYHEIDSNGDITKFSCGSKYDPKDNTACMICQAAIYKRSKDEAVDAWWGTGGFPCKYETVDVLECWRKGSTPEPLDSWKPALDMK